MVSVPPEAGNEVGLTLNPVPLTVTERADDTPVVVMVAVLVLDLST